jgi:hypothetical protein
LPGFALIDDDCFECRHAMSPSAILSWPREV